MNFFISYKSLTMYKAQDTSFYFSLLRIIQRVILSPPYHFDMFSNEFLSMLHNKNLDELLNFN